MTKLRTQQIRAYNTPKKATLGDRVKLTPMPDGLFYDETRGVYIQCAPYDNHFIGMNPDFLQGKETWFALCSCGSPAVIVGYDAYKKDASPSGVAGVKEIAKGEMLVCYLHASNSVHADGSS